MDFSIIVPAYNEERIIRDTLRKVSTYFEERYSFEIIVVDDGSSDKTREFAEVYAKDNGSVKVIGDGANRGKGYAVRKGVEAASGKYILFTDADLSTPIEEVEKLKLWLENGYDMAIGIRGPHTDGVYKPQPFIRRMAGNYCFHIINFIVPLSCSDSQCGFKCFSYKCAKDVFSKTIIDGFIFDVEVIYLAQVLGYKVREVSVSWINDTNSKVNLLTDPIKMILDLFKLRRDINQGLYGSKKATSI